MDYPTIVSQYGVPSHSWRNLPTNVRKRIKKAIRRRQSTTTIAGRLYSAITNYLPITKLRAISTMLRGKLRKSHHAYLAVPTMGACNPSTTMEEPRRCIQTHSPHHHDAQVADKYTPENLRTLQSIDAYKLTSAPFLALPPAHNVDLFSRLAHVTVTRSILHSPLPNTHTLPSQLLKSITSPRSQARFQACIANPTRIARRVLKRNIRKRKRNQSTENNSRVLERCKRKLVNEEFMLLEMQRSIIAKSQLPTSSRGLRLSAYALDSAS